MLNQPTWPLPPREKIRGVSGQRRQLSNSPVSHKTKLKQERSRQVQDIADMIATTFPKCRSEAGKPAPSKLLCPEPAAHELPSQLKISQAVNQTKHGDLPIQFCQTNGKHLIIYDGIRFLHGLRSFGNSVVADQNQQNKNSAR